MPALATHALTKDFAVGFWRKRPYRALDQLTLDVEAGEVFGFLGPNGAGKTTTLKLLMQLVYPTSGTAELLGKPLGDLSAKHRIGFLPENPYFYDYLTAEELLTYFAALFGYRGADRRARTSRMLDEVGLGAERRMPLRKFSKGMLQRVGIAQALINDPELVIFDEPMSGLDPLGRKDVRDLILSLRDEGKTVFFSSHILEDAEVICDQVAIILSGKIVRQGYLDELLGQEVVGSELVVEAIPESLFAELQREAGRAVVQGTRFLFEFSSEGDAEKALDRVRASGGRIRSFVPRRKSLEDLLLEGLHEEKAR